MAIPSPGIAAPVSGLPADSRARPRPQSV